MILFVLILMQFLNFSQGESYQTIVQFQEYLIVTQYKSYLLILTIDGPWSYKFAVNKDNHLALLNLIFFDGKLFPALWHFYVIVSKLSFICTLYRFITHSLIFWHYFAHYFQNWRSWSIKKYSWSLNFILFVRCILLLSHCRFRSEKVLDTWEKTLLHFYQWV